MLFTVISNFFLTTVSISASTGHFQGVGIAAFLPVLMYGLIQTGLSEELLFRGFLAKRFINRFGFTFGNTLQASLFGFLHVVIACLVMSITVVHGCFLFLLPFLCGWLFGYINEKQAGGSIMPSWLMHGIGNMIVSMILMFTV